MKTRQFVLMATLAALYAVFTVVLAPVSFGPVQFRASEILKVFVLFDPVLAFGIGLGTLIANLFSPMVGPWELLFMPLTDMAGGFLAWWLYKAIQKKSPYPPMILYSITTGFAVGLMLSYYGFGAWLLAALPVIGSELVLLIVGTPIIMGMDKVLRARGLDLSTS